MIENSAKKIRYNIHEPIYGSIESDLVDLSYSVTFDDKQLDVYSPRIAEIILRAAVEIESIAHELYIIDNGSKENISYQNVIDSLDKRHNLHNAVVLCALNNNCFSLENSILYPFIGWKHGEKKDKHGDLVLGGWNYAYQTLKHDKENNKYLAIKKYGTLKYALWTLSALFYLNYVYNGSSRTIASSNLFNIVQKNDTGEYGCWRPSKTFMHRVLDDTTTNLINKKLSNNNERNNNE